MAYSTILRRLTSPHMTVFRSMASPQNSHRPIVGERYATTQRPPPHHDDCEQHGAPKYNVEDRWLYTLAKPDHRFI